MIEAPLTHYEPYRLEKLRALGILDTPPEKYYDEIVALAAELCGTTKAYVTLIDEQRQWIKAALGEEQSQTDRGIAFCAHTILGDDVLEVPDAQLDPRFENNPQVTGDPFIRFYAGAPLTTEDGFNLGALCVISDQPRELDDKQKYMLSILARAVVKEMELRSELNFRTKLEQDLRTARAEALFAAKAKSQFLSIMTHELRNPLNALLGFTHLLDAEPLEGSTRELVDGIKVSGNQLLYLVNDVLDYNKLEEGKVELFLEPVELATYLNGLLIAHTANAAAKGLSLQLKLDKHAPLAIKADQHRLGQILNNLLSNAIKFTHYGHVELAVSLQTSSKSKAILTFSVSDTGIGIRPEHQQSIFESYSQGDASTSKKYGGTGLGLSICTKLVQLMGGTLNLSTEPGEGSIFYFSLEFEIAKASQANAPVNAMPEADFGGAKVLLTDDLDLNRMVIKRFLQRWNLVVTEAADGQEAIERFEAQQPDVILLDLIMPNMDGEQAAKIIKEKSNVPILALTGRSEAEMQTLLDSKLFDGYVPKPFEPLQLFELLQGVLKRGWFCL